MKSASVVACVRRVRTHWRQFHRRQVTPASSRQTISPAVAVWIAGWPSATVSNGSSPAATTSRAGPW